MEGERLIEDRIVTGKGSRIEYINVSRGVRLTLFRETAKMQPNTVLSKKNVNGMRDWG